MVFKVETAPVPIHFDEQGTARIANTRVTLETVLWTFNEGASAEEIVSRFPSLRLADVYAVIAHYLHNRDEIDLYLRETEAQETVISERLETISPQVGLREKLLNRRVNKST